MKYLIRLILSFLLLLCAPIQRNAYTQNFESDETYIKAVSYLEDRDYKQAIKELQIYILLQPQSSRGYNNLGYCYYKTNHFDLAETNYRKALTLDPTYATASNNLGIVLYKTKHYKEAIDCYKRAIQMNSYYSKAIINLAIVYWKTGNKSKARDCFEQAKLLNDCYVESRVAAAKSFMNP